MAQYDKRILNKLLDTYENSLLSVGKNKRNVNIEFRFTKTAFPEYFDESSCEYENIHIAMKLLEEKGLLTIIWKDKKVGYMIQKVRLEDANAAQAYAYVRRKPKHDLEESIREFLSSYCEGGEGSPIAKEFACFLKNRLENRQSVKEYIDISKPDETRRLFWALTCVEENVASCYIREFSISRFQDSKYFEQIKNRVAKIFRRFHAEYTEMDASEILAEYGIYHTPNYVYLKGHIAVSMGEEEFGLALLRQGIGISGEDLQNIAFSNLSDIKQVITVENLTTFFRWQEPGSLIIYLGGYHNGVRRALLKKIYEKLPEIPYCHFGDIDAGGFAILKDLRAKTGILFRPYHMDLDTLKQYEKYGKPLTDSDRARLEEIGKSGEFREVIAYMLEHNVKLEQECVGIG